MASEAGKGDGTGPMDVPREQFDQSHVRIFGEPKRARWIPPPLPAFLRKPKPAPIPPERLQAAIEHGAGGDMVRDVEGRVAPAYGLMGGGDE